MRATGDTPNREGVFTAMTEGPCRAWGVVRDSTHHVGAHVPRDCETPFNLEFKARP